MTSLLATRETVYKFEREQVSTWEGLEGGKKVADAITICLKNKIN